MSKLLVTLTVEELEELIGKTVAAVLAKRGPEKPLDPVMTSEEASDFLKMPITVLRSKARAGIVPSFKIGSLTRFRASELNEFLANQPRTKKAG